MMNVLILVVRLIHALVWDINEKLSRKLLYGRAFRAPGFLEQKQQNSQIFTGNPDLDPETIETVDVTLNSQRFSGHIDFSASVRNVFDSHGKEPAVSAFPNSLPIPSRSFYLQTTVHF